MTLADIEAARELIRDVAIETPMEQSRWLSALVGGPVSLKCENLQRTGSFKARGAFTRISRLSARGACPRRRRRLRRQPRPGRRARRAAARHHARPSSCPRGRRSPRRRPPARTAPTSSSRAACLEESLAAARRFAEETGAVLIHPFDHVDIVTGQGTLGLEVLEQAPEVQTVIVPTGGGGLLARRRDRGQGHAARRPGRRRPGGGRGGVPGLARGGPPRCSWSR